MKYSKSELLQFMLGYIMLAAGLFLFSYKVVVYSSILNEYLFIISLEIPFSMIFVPLLIGLVWKYLRRTSILAKITIVSGALVIAISILLSKYMTLLPISIYEWIIQLVLLFTGVALLTKAFFKSVK